MAAANIATSYAASMERLRSLQARERADARINPDCSSIVFEHGQRVRRSIVCLHGITSSPVQFRDLGELFYSRGYNVVIPRLPRHGYRDRLTHDPARLTVAEYQAYADEAIEIGRGLGAHLTVAGLSVGGVVAAWCAQTRSDVDLAVPIAPSFAPYGVPLRLVPVLSRLVRMVPNIFVPWDLRNPSQRTSSCSYPRFSTHALAESFRLGTEVFRAAARQPPSAGAILAITNAGDTAVNNSATRALIKQWRTHAAANVREYIFEPGLRKLHDIIGPYQPGARVEYVYPVLFDLVDSNQAAARTSSSSDTE
jgi:pimeloyl-ACP methyl ester carboxylesterase